MDEDQKIDETLKEMIKKREDENEAFKKLLEKLSGEKSKEVTKKKK